MKANAPEKLYLHPTANGKVGASWLTFPLTNEDIEYTRIDAFIDKACEYMITHIPDMHILGVSAKMDELIIEDFRKYMKGE